MKVNIMLRENCPTKLMFVKILKEYTELGLKDTKEICDRLHEMPYRPVEIDIKDSNVDQLRQDLLNIDLNFIMNGDRRFERERVRDA